MTRNHAVTGRVCRPGTQLLCLLAMAAGAACAASDQRPPAERYGVAFQATLIPDQAIALVSIDITQNSRLLRELDFNMDPAVHSDFQASGDWQLDAGRLRWKIPRTGGRLTFTAKIPHARGPQRYDAWITDRWAIFRGDDLFPAARVRAATGATAEATLRIAAPEGWSAVTPYGKGVDQTHPVRNPKRNFDRPTGWMAAGVLGVRREHIMGTEVAVAGPVGQGIRRQDMLALMNWTLPELAKVFGPLPAHVLIVSAADPMWRGGLSGPASLFIHADRPLISENGTSPLLHELVHVLAGVQAAPGDDWLTEGLAEFYALEVLRRSGTITPSRYQAAHQQLAAWGADVTRLDGDDSRGKTTARAVTLLRKLHADLVNVDSSLDAVVAHMRAAGVLSRDSLAAAVASTAGEALPAFATELNALLAAAPAE